MELIKKIVERHGAEALEDLLDIILCDIKISSPELFNKEIERLEASLYAIHRPEAERIVKTMRPFGEHWTYEQIEEFIHGKGVAEHICEWYLVMNMVYNDYHKTAEMVGKDADAEFYYSLARDFIDDADGRPHKVGWYFME